MDDSYLANSFDETANSLSHQFFSLINFENSVKEKSSLLQSLLSESKNRETMIQYKSQELDISRQKLESERNEYENSITQSRMEIDSRAIKLQDYLEKLDYKSNLLIKRSEAIEQQMHAFRIKDLDLDDLAENIENQTASVLRFQTTVPNNDIKDLSYLKSKCKKYENKILLVKNEISQTKERIKEMKCHAIEQKSETNRKTNFTQNIKNKLDDQSTDAKEIEALRRQINIEQQDQKTNYQMIAKYDIEKDNIKNRIIDKQNRVPRIKNQLKIIYQNFNQNKENMESKTNEISHINDMTARYLLRIQEIKMTPPKPLDPKIIYLIEKRKRVHNRMERMATQLSRLINTKKRLASKLVQLDEKTIELENCAKLIDTLEEKIEKKMYPPILDEQITQPLNYLLLELYEQIDKAKSVSYTMQYVDSGYSEIKSYQSQIENNHKNIQNRIDNVHLSIDDVINKISEQQLIIAKLTKSCNDIKEQNDNNKIQNVLDSAEHDDNLTEKLCKVSDLTKFVDKDLGVLIQKINQKEKSIYEKKKRILARMDIVATVMQEYGSFVKDTKLGLLLSNQKKQIPYYVKARHCIKSRSNNEAIC